MSFPARQERQRLNRPLPLQICGELLNNERASASAALNFSAPGRAKSGLICRRNSASLHKSLLTKHLAVYRFSRPRNQKRQADCPLTSWWFVSEKKMSKAILYDATLCIDCKACEQACAERNKLPYDDAIAAEQVQSEHKFTVVLAKGDKFMRRLCMNCEDPTCASVCPVGAMRKTRPGPVIYEEVRCMGCRYCMVACPFGVPKYEWNKMLPRGRKCDMCADRRGGGKQTACAEACPTGATKFGERDELSPKPRSACTRIPATTSTIFTAWKKWAAPRCCCSPAVPFEDFGYRTDLAREPLPLLHLPRAVAHSRRARAGRRVAGRGLVDYQPPRRSSGRRSARLTPTKKEKMNVKQKLMQVHVLEGGVRRHHGCRSLRHGGALHRRAWAPRPT